MHLRFALLARLEFAFEISSNQDDLLDRPRQSARRRRRQCAGATLPGLITPQPTRNGDMRPCTGRSKLRGTSGTRSGK
jgi:hypothetical protein